MTPEPIAVVGMACRFAGAPDVHAYWDQALSGAQAFGPVPADRWDTGVFATDGGRDPDRSYTRHGAFLDDVATFPALALGIPPRRAEVMDPQQRLVLEACLQAVEDAGITGDELPGRTGVFMGVTAGEYRLLLAARVVARLLATGALGTAPADPGQLADAVARVVPPRPFTATGVLGNMVAAAVAHQLDLHGPAVTVDAACASSLVAVDDAVRRLRTGQIDAALVGGVYVSLTPEHHIAFSRLGAISASGRCLPFDRRGDGFVEGEGVGVVLLRRRADAERDGDRIYALIAGSAVNADGRTDGVMTPSADGQADVIREAWRDAALDPGTLGYLEAHGTATAVGDRTEARGLLSALGAGASHVPVGSAKANVGHTMSAAGVAGLIRAALAIHHRVVPPMAGYQEARPELGDTPLTFPVAATGWLGPDRVAAVSSFGFGGTNAHVVLRSVAPRPAGPVGFEPELVLLSAPDPATLRDHAGRIAAAVERDAGTSVTAVARALAVRRPQAVRLAVVTGDREELLAALRAAATGAGHRALRVGSAVSGRPRLAFLYPGQGAQQIGMGRALHRFGAFGAALDRLERALEGETAAPLTELLYPERSQHRVGEAAEAARLTATENCQPALVGIGAALTELLAAVGVRPDVVAGHSVGEFTAAVAAGALLAEDAVRFAARRGRAMADLDGDRGAMAAVFADRDVVSALLAPGAVVANVNHPRQQVVSGTTAAVAAVVSAARRAGVRAVPLDVSHGFHSPVLDGVDLSDLVAELPLTDPSLPFASGILDRPITTAAEARASFVRHATAPVDFVGALDQVAAAGCDLVLQVSTGGPLASMARAGLRRPVVEIGPSTDDDGHSFLTALGQLWTAGCDVDPRSVTRPVPPASLPPSPLPRERYWAVVDRPDFPLDRLDRAVDRPLPPPADEPRPAVVPAPGTVAADAGGGGDLAAAVRAALAEVSAYPVELLTDDAALVDDLGFDSLMLASFAEELAGRVPESVPDEALVRARTVGDVVALLAGAGAVVPEAPPATSAPPPGADPPEGSAAGPRRCRDAAGWPEVQELAARRAAAAEAGFDDPYFRVRDGRSGPHAQIAGRGLLAFTSYDYLGLAADPRVAAAVAEAVTRYGTSVSASRVASGERAFHGELERELARAQGAEAALVFTSGHATNVGVIGHLVRPGDLVVHDQLAHDSIVQGARLSGAERVVFRHDDLEHLERVLAALRSRSDRCLVVVEGVYSMDGDVCRLPELVALKERYDCLLMVDEAHSFGVLGDRGLGVGEHSGVPGSAVDVWMGTLSKSLASCGGWIAGSEALITWLRYTTPGFVFSAGITPSNAQAARTALQLMRAEPERVSRLRANAAFFHARLTEHGVDTGTCRGESAVVPVITGSSAGALDLGQRLFRDGIDVQPILHPAVPEDSARLRFFLSEGHAHSELDATAALVARHLGRA